MTRAGEACAPASPGTGRYTAERWLRVPIDRVWAQWTTAEGFETWWGPEDLVVHVRSLDVRPGGRMELSMEYVVTARFPEQSTAFEAAGVPTSVHVRGTFTEVEPPTRLAFDQRWDYGPGADGFQSKVRLELRDRTGGTDLLVTVEGEMSDHWRTLGLRNLEGQLDRLVRTLTPRNRGNANASGSTG
jgi:uncharacterized protein YndB with AHSA1/START domain